MRNKTKTFDTGKTIVVWANPDDMSYEEVKRLLRANKIPLEDFKHWMHGQTCPLLESGQMGYFRYDVKRFINWKKGGKTPIWD